MYRTAYRTADVDGLKVFYRYAGPPDAPVILLLHGFPSSSRMWQPLLDRLAGPFRLVAPDYPGFGHSDAPSHTEFAYTFDHLAAVIGRFTEVLGLRRYTLVVQDYGYPAWQDWLRQHQPPLLVRWGRYDPSFQVEEAEAYRREVPAAEVHILDAGHFALDEQPDAIADLTRGFLGRPTRNDRLR